MADLDPVEVPFFDTLEVIENHHWMTRGFSGRGDLEFQGQLRFGGTWRGHISSNDPEAHLVVLKGAKIEGALHVAQISIEGQVEDGELRAKKVRLLEGARVRGRVLAESLVVEPGAVLEGRVQSLAEKPTKVS